MRFLNSHTLVHIRQSAKAKMYINAILGRNQIQYLRLGSKRSICDASNDFLFKLKPIFFPRYSRKKGETLQRGRNRSREDHESFG